MLPSLFWTQSSGKDIISSLGGRELRSVLDGYFRYGGSSINLYSLPKTLYYGLETGIIPVGDSIKITPHAQTVCWFPDGVKIIKSVTDFLDSMHALGYVQVGLQEAKIKAAALITSYEGMYGSADGCGLLDDVSPEKVVCFSSLTNKALINKSDSNRQIFVSNPDLICAEFLNKDLFPLQIADAREAAYIKIRLSAVTISSANMQAQLIDGKGHDRNYIGSRFFDLGDGAAKVEDTKADLPVVWRSDCAVGGYDQPTRVWFSNATKNLDESCERANQAILKAASFLQDVYHLDCADDAVAYISGESIRDRIDKLSAKLNHYGYMMDQVTDGTLAIKDSDFSLAKNRDAFLDSLGDNFREIYYSLGKNGNAPEKGTLLVYNKYRKLQTLDGIKKALKFTASKVGKIVILFSSEDKGYAIWFDPEDSGSKVKNPSAHDGSFLIGIVPKEYPFDKVTRTYLTKEKQLVELRISEDSSESELDVEKRRMESISKVENCKLNPGDTIVFGDVPRLSGKQVSLKNDLADTIESNIKLAGFLFGKRLNSCSQELVYEFKRYTSLLESYVNKIRKNCEPNSVRVDNAYYHIVSENYEPRPIEFKMSAYSVWLNVDNSYLDSFTSALTAYRGSAGMGKNGSNQALVNIIKQMNDRTQKVSYAPAVSLGFDKSGKTVLSFVSDELTYRDYMQYMCGNFMYAPYGFDVIYKAAKLIYSHLHLENMVSVPDGIGSISIQSTINANLANVRAIDMGEDSSSVYSDYASELANYLNKELGLKRPCGTGMFSMPDRSYQFTGHSYVGFGQPATKFSNKKLCLPYWCAYTSRNLFGRSLPIPQYCFSLLRDAGDPFNGAISFGGTFATIHLAGDVQYVSYVDLGKDITTIEDLAIYCNKEEANERD